ncbi:MAG: hypothetical protein ACFFCX_03000 [Candidatus Sifarchaeia archaeon]
MVEEDRGLTKRRCEEVLDDKNRGKLMLNLRRVFRHPLLFLKVTDPFITAHHPTCAHFDSHSVTIRGRKWCIGCTFNSISFFVAMFLLLVVWLIDTNLLNRFYLFWGGVVGSAVYFLVSFSGLADRGTKTKVGSKFILGFSFASICWSILLLNGLFSPGLELKIILILTLYLCFVTVMNIKRSYEVFHECEECEYKMRWSKCPGFREIACRLVEEGFVAPVEKKSIDHQDV